jgi:hypothetical protein
MLELTKDFAIAILEELSYRPYRDVQPLFLTLANLINQLPETKEAPKPFEPEIYMGNQ